MQQFTFVRVTEPNVALKELDGDGCGRFIAGGTTLLDLMKLNVESPVRVVDINHLPLDKIEVTDSVIRVGALVRNSELAYHEAVRSRCPVLSEALLSGATPQIRNMATLGGNLLQRTRCPYFRDTAWACNKREPGAGCSALDGYNRSHAILGTSDKCIATHPSDMCVALTALDATILVQGPTGSRTIPIGEFYVAYGEDPVRETTLRPGELITTVEITTSPLFRRSHYLKVRDRASFEFALASAAVALDIQGGIVRAARVALGGVATKPWRATKAEKLLNGAKADDAAFAKAAQAELQGAKPRNFNEFKVELVKRCIVRALSTVAAMS
jgi:xanthine dehydrogenase YagS FAD-binding subunit